MAVNVFPSAGIQTPDGMTLVGVLGNNTSISHAGNTRFINLSMKVNTPYIFRFYRSDNGSTTTFPNIFFYKDSDGTYGQLISGQTISSGSNFPYIDTAFYNTTSNITRLLFNSAQSQVTGFVAIYEASTQIGRSALFYATDSYSDSSTSAWPASRTSAKGGFQAQANGFVFEQFTGVGINPTTVYRTSDGVNYTKLTGADSPADDSFSFNASNRVTTRLWAAKRNNNLFNTVRLYFSDNNGSSWSTSDISGLGSDYPAAMAPGFAKNLNNGNGLLFTSRTSALGTWSAFSTNNGASWTSNNGPFGFNQGSGGMVIAFDNQIIIAQSDDQGGNNYRCAWTSNGSTFTYFTFSNAVQPSAIFFDSAGGYPLIESNGTQAFITGYAGSATAWGYAAQNIGGTPTLTTVSAPEGGQPVLLQTKNAWIAYSSTSTSNSVYYTSPMVYNTGAEFPRSPGSWTQRTMTSSSPFAPAAMPRGSSNNFIFHANRSSASTTRFRTDVIPAGFTQL